MAEDRANNQESTSPSSLEELSATALAAYGRSLGLDVDPGMSLDTLRETVRQRRRLLERMDRQAMLDVVMWARRPVRASASKEELAREIAAITKTSFASLSHRGMLVLAQLRGLDLPPNPTDRDLLAALNKSEGLWLRIQRGRRKLAARLLAGLVGDTPADEEYQFLPEEGNRRPQRSLKRQIEDQGLVGGIRASLKGAADNYVAEKLDEIERRIDYKLDQIDRRLAEWRDREVAARLRIVKITLVATILVAVVSLAYELAKTRVATPSQQPPPVTRTAAPR